MPFVIVDFRRFDALKYDIISNDRYYTHRKMRYKLKIAYDGTSFAGWQVQKNALSIQSLVQKALETFLRHPIALTGSGRTDAGVHALGQVAHFDTDVPFEAKRLLLSLNALLPEEIRCLSIQEVALDFHARYSASSKIYHYRLHVDRILNPFTRFYSCPVFGPFDVDAVREGAKIFLGTHDFSSFANASLRKDHIRTMYRLDVVRQGSEVTLQFEANGFLYKMVRNLTGALLKVGSDGLSLQELQAIFEAKDRKKAPSTAPAQGLFLMDVVY